MLGIVLGVSSLMATLALTAGIEIGTRSFMEQMGGLELVRVVDKEVSSRNEDFWNLSPGRTQRDAEIMLQSVEGVTAVSPQLHQGVRLRVGEQTERYRAKGVWPMSYDVEKHELAAGRYVTWMDVEDVTKAVVIGNSVARELFPETPISSIPGRSVTINQVPFKVVGVLKRYAREQTKRRREIARARRGGKDTVGRSRMWDPFRRKNQSVLIPFSTMFYQYKAGQFPLDAMETIKLNSLEFKVEDLSKFRETLESTRAALSITHRGVDDFDFETREEWFDRMEASISATRLSGGMIAVISLVVGAIGITNIMLASISERVREIGIRLAVGAKGRDIFFQILVESISVAAIGGIIGVGSGLVLVEVLEVLAPTENLPVILPGSVAISFAFALVTGILSGLYPALKASQLDPMEALRYE